MARIITVGDTIQRRDGTKLLVTKLLPDQKVEAAAMIPNWPFPNAPTTVKLSHCQGDLVTGTVR